MLLRSTVIGFGAEGEVYGIETKLARNPDRRTVVAQALDYGAALWTGYMVAPTSTRGFQQRATKSPFTLRSDGRLMVNLGYVGEVPAWRVTSPKTPAARIVPRRAAALGRCSLR